MVVYPRWRGEHINVIDYNWQGAGLSPLARGTPERLGALIPPNRFIPAGAGNTKWRDRRADWRSVYPRWRGEHWRCWRISDSERGLSPLARGTLVWFQLPHGTPRFIPAGAGNTINRSRRIILPPVYPRWRGEHTITSVKAWSRIGLSPLARGTLYYNRWTRYGARFIPAGAGNTCALILSRLSESVYPRWRGEHWQIEIMWYYSHGLSPLARGTRHSTLRGRFVCRFIPAGAGNTGQLLGLDIFKTVYPRWRGEHGCNLHPLQ